MSKQRPILFSTPMVQAILEGRKTQTRRIVKPQPRYIESSGRWEYPLPKKHSNSGRCTAVYSASREWHEYLPKEVCPYGQVGDVLWVRETWWSGYILDERDCIPENAPIKYWYFAHTRDARPCDMSDEKCMFLFGPDKKTWPHWKPSIHMPYAACRLFLEITDIRVERLLDISEEDAKAEGVEQTSDGVLNQWRDYTSKFGFQATNSKWSFQSLWQSINGPESWKANPWVWVVSFKRIDRPE